MTTSDDAPCAPVAASSSAAQAMTMGKRVLCMGDSDRGGERGSSSWYRRRLESESVLFGLFDSRSRIGANRSDISYRRTSAREASHVEEELALARRGAPRGRST